MTDLNALPLPDLFAALNQTDLVGRLLALAVEEDLGPGASPGDITTACSIPPSVAARGAIIAREPGILAGAIVLPRIAALLAPDCRLDLLASDGESLLRAQPVARLSGPLHQVLRAERLMLNTLGRMCGIATRTAEFVRLISGTRARLLDTRKTTPGLRVLEKYAVRCGGGHCHRIGLHDAVLLKDNHLFGIPPADLPAFITRAARAARDSALAADHPHRFPLQFVELEVDSLDQFRAIIAAGGCGVDIILLDNMGPDRLQQAVAIRREHNAPILLEASGGVTRETIRAIAETGIDRISVGGLTHHAVNLDLALDLEARD